MAAQETFYNYDPALLPAGQTKGTITHRQLGEVYERITSNRMSVRTNWNIPLQQLNALLALCKLPSLSPLILTSAQAAACAETSLSVELAKAQVQKWPPFSTLKTLYRRK